MERLNRLHQRIESAPTSERITEKIAQAFMKNRYPISERGRALQHQVEQIMLITNDRERQSKLLRLRSELPTVETPHPELFEELEISADDNETIFGFDLDLVTITKGCTHGCTHCTVDAKKLSPENIMPFMAIIRIAEQKRKFEDVSHAAWQSWYDDTAAERQMLSQAEATNDPIRIKQTKTTIRLELEKKFHGHKISEHFSTFGPVLARSPDVMRSLYLTFDGEPSDYRDETFLHEDGTPAHWGDVFTTLSTPLRSVSFSTAGWPETDRSAQVGAEVIVAALQKDARLKDVLAISLNPYDRYYKKNSAAYGRAMEKIIRLFGPFKPTLLIRGEIGDENFDRFFQEIYTPLVFMYLDEFVHEQADIAAMQRSLRATQVRFGKTSHFHGRAFLPGHETDPDPLLDSAGVHIWPSGVVAHKEHNQSAKMFRPGRGVKGVYPQATAKRIYTI